MFKILFRWIRSLFKRNNKKYITYKTDDVIKKPIKVKRSFKVKKNYPVISERTYSRTYSRHYIAKLKRQEKADLVLQGKRKDDKGVIMEVQQPYRKDKYKSLNEYNRYAKLFNYNNR